MHTKRGIASARADGADPTRSIVAIRADHSKLRHSELTVLSLLW